ncbi:MAG: NDP-sugar synthase [Myxococcaceae bacterium]
MKGMVLCAGLGTRLRPLTNRWPKPAMPLLAGPLVRYAFATLESAGVSSFAINSHWLPEVMEAVALADRPGLTISRELPEVQGTGGGIRGLKSFLSDGDFVVTAGDVLFAVDLKPVIAAHRASGAAATMVLLPMPEGKKYNAVEIDPSRAVRRIAGKGPGGEKLSGWHFTGVHVMTPKVFDFMKASGPEDINHDVYPRLIEAGLTVQGHLLEPKSVYWSDLGTPESYAATHQHLLFGQVPLESFGDHGPLAGHPRMEGLNGWAHPTAKLDADVKFAGPCFFGEGAVVEAGVRLGAAVSVGKGARVGQGARLNRVAVLDGGEVAANTQLNDALVGPGGVVVSALPKT